MAWTTLLRRRTPGRVLRASAAAVVCCALGAGLLAGPSGGELEQQRPKWHIDHIPPAPILTPEEEQATFKLPEGFRIELVAAEPLVEEPVALAFDPDGRMYVVEMRGYMIDLEGHGQLDPVGRVVRLESSKGDGKYDKSTTFLDHLVAPRAIGLAGDGVLVAEPPNLWFCRDTDGDGTCDDKKLIVSDYGSRQPNPEHMANGLVPALDNWYYNADYSFRFRYSKGQFLRDGTIARGQWGIAQDDVGRLFYNSNSSMLRCDLVAAQSFTRNPYLTNRAGVNVGIASNATFPGRVTPGVNRGYTEDVNLEGKLQRVTAACGPTIYRGDNFPPEYRGNAFVCEPSGNLVSRQVIDTDPKDGITLKAKGVQHDGIDFLTSTDERFRPVSLYTAPDGSLYVVDMYHGIIQHRTYVSAYLEDQIKQRDLEKNDGHRGRIWRIVHESGKATPLPKLAKAPSAELAKNLSHPNGWWRDTCQRLLVERMDKSVVPLLQQIVAGEAKDATPPVTPLGKIHALWTLQGMEKLEDDVASAAAEDADPRVRLASLRAGELLVRKKTGPGMTQAAAKLARDPDPQVQLQVLTMASPDLPEIQAAATAILNRHMGEPLFHAAAINGATGRELELLNTLLTDKSLAASKARSELLNDLAECVARSRSGDRINKLLDLIASQPETAKAAQEAMLAGVLEAVSPASRGKTSGPVRRLRLPREPKSLEKLLENPEQKVVDLAKKIDDGLSWPDKPGDTTPPLKPLTPEQERRFAAGRDVFTTVCAQCHQPSGLGQEGTAPPLVDSEWVLGPPERTARIVLHGLHGPIQVGRRTMDLEMPGLKAFDDEQIASVLTYIRREWGHEANPVDPVVVARARKVTANRGDLQWTAEELKKEFPDPEAPKTRPTSRPANRSSPATQPSRNNRRSARATQPR